MQYPAHGKIYVESRKSILFIIHDISSEKIHSSIWDRAKSWLKGLTNEVLSSLHWLVVVEALEKISPPTNY